MSLKGNTREEQIWNYLIAAIKNPFGVAGLMGNLYAESALNPQNLQNTYEKKLGFTDASYTKAVDSDKYHNFVRDSAGYGLAQWTYWSRKENLLAFAQRAKKSIGDLETQLVFLMDELTNGYPSVLRILKNGKTVRETSDAVLLKFERPANQGESVQKKRAEYGQKYYDKYADKTSTKGEVTMANSPLVSYTKLSKNRNSPRNKPVDTITPHCIVGQWTAKQGCDYFATTDRDCSANYVVGKDGDVGLSVDEKDRSWCSSSSSNDHRAITIEVASDTKDPYAITDKAYNALIDLMTDICKRHGKKKLLWFADKTKTLNYTPKSDEMVITVHRWFANKSCPGDYIYNRLGTVADTVTKRLGGAMVTPVTPAPAPVTPAPATKKVSATKVAQKKDTSLKGTYTTITDLHCRNGSSTSDKSLIVMPKGTKVQCYGYYNLDAKGAKWLYIQFTLNGVQYTGFSHSSYLKK